MNVTIDSDRFTWSGNVGVIEASECGVLGTRIAVKSARTGCIRVFVLDREERDSEGEVVCWVLVDRCSPVCLHILND